MVGLFGDAILWKKLTPDLKIKKRDFDKFKIRELFGMGGWITVNQIGSLLFLNIDLIVANIFLGAKVAGEYGTILLFPALLRSLAGSAISVLNPLLVTRYAKDDFTGMGRITKRAIRFMGIAVSLPVGVLSGLGYPFLQLWLGTEFGNLWLLLIILIIHLPINLAVMPLFGNQVALNKVKIPAVVTLVLGLVNLLLSIFFIVHLNWGAYGIAISGAIILTIKNVVFTPIYGARIDKNKWNTYLKSFLPGSIMTILMFFMSYLSTLVINFDSWIKLLVVILFFGIIFLTILFSFILNREDKEFLFEFLPAFIK